MWSLSRQHHAAPASAVDCSTVVLNMVDCLSYVSSGSTVSKPEGTCCSSLKTVLKSKCLCEVFKNSAQFGFCLNVTKALALPSACKITAPSVSNCGAPTTPKEKQRKQKRVEDPDEPKRKEKRQKGGNSGILAPIPLSDALVKFIGTGETVL